MLPRLWLARMELAAGREHEHVNETDKHESDAADEQRMRPLRCQRLSRDLLAPAMSAKLVLPFEQKRRSGMDSGPASADHLLYGTVSTAAMGFNSRCLMRIRRHAWFLFLCILHAMQHIHTTGGSEWQREKARDLFRRGCRAYATSKVRRNHGWRGQERISCPSMWAPTREAHRVGVGTLFSMTHGAAFSRRRA